MNDEQRLIEKLRRIEALFSGATTTGEREAAASAMERIRDRLRQTQKSDPPVEYKFTLTDSWSNRLFSALLRRYGLDPYRYRGQRHTTVMCRVPKTFVDETLWPEFVELNRTLRAYLGEITGKVIAEGVHVDSSEAEIRNEPLSLEFPKAPLETTERSFGQEEN